MEQKTDNQLIAEFMGMTSSFDTYFDTTQNCHFEIKDFKYDTSWDWHPDFTSVNWRRQVIDMPISSDLKSVYDKVVRFIQNYNQQSK